MHKLHKDAGEILEPGAHVGVNNGVALSDGTLKSVGIVDPFLKKPVKKGQIFWLIIYPRTITSLKHVWEHPDFKDVVSALPEIAIKAKSEEWLRRWCDTTKDAPTYEELLELMDTGESRSKDGDHSWRNEGEYLLSLGQDAHGEIPERELVAKHVKVLTGKTVVVPEYFSCSC